MKRHKLRQPFPPSTSSAMLDDHNTAPSGGDARDYHDENETQTSCGDEVPEGYVAVPWPESQGYAEEDWFQEEAQLINGGALYEELSDAAYLIPDERLPEKQAPAPARSV